MNETENKITAIKNSEDQEKVKQKYEAEISAKEQQALDWHNACIKKDDEILELQKSLKRVREEAEDWKREASVVRKAQAETKQHKEQQDFQTEYLKLQAQKGWDWDEARGWSKTK
jgi:hypothetical protein